jgi:hypothetical protein
VTIDDSEIEDSGAGGASLEGYEYQIDVSIWIALDLILALRAAQELQLEPTSQEDAEADMSVASTLAVDSYRLMVQAKLRGGDAWSVKAVASLLNHGTRRVPVKDRLKDPSIRYLLITSAGLNGGTRGMSVRGPGLWPRAGDMPQTIAQLLDDSARGRVAIIGALDEPRLQTHIKELLIETFRVPMARWVECRQVLRNETRSRIRGAGLGRWRVEDLEAVIRDHDGYIANSPELEHYIHPTNWADLKQILKERHAAIIIGQSGTGKTMATKQLYSELRQSIPGLSRVAVTRGPQQINKDQTTPPVLFDIEDPWGRFDFEQQNRPWNDQLAHCFSNASPTRVFIATSRLDVAQSSGAYDTVKPWVFTLEAEHYGGHQRVALYRTRIAALPRLLQALATTGEREVLRELTTPLEIQKFFDALTTLDPADILKNSLECRKRAIAQAHQNSIERTVVEQIGQRDDVRAAAVIWALLRANDKLSLTALRRLEDKLADLDSKFEKGVQPLVGFFIAARNLRQSNDVVAYYHPRVEAGIEKTMRADTLVVRRALRTLIDALVLLDETDGFRGAFVAAKVVAACSTRLHDLKPEIREAAQIGIDAWIGIALLRGDREFDSHLKIAASAGSNRCNAAEVARFLLARKDNDNRWDFGLSYWFCTPHDEEWYARMSADPVARQVVETFVCTSLPNMRDSFDHGFTSEVRRLTPDVTRAFVDAALNIVHSGVVHNSDVIAFGALFDIDAFEQVVDEAVKALTPSRESLEKAEQLRLDIENDVYSEDYAQHLSENDEGYTAHEFVKAYLERVRHVDDWRRIARHRHSGFLLDYWLRALDSEQKPSPEELAEAFSRSYKGDSEGEMWRALLRVWDVRYLTSAVERVIEGHRERSTQASALFCIVRHAPEKISGVIAHLQTAGDDFRLAEIGIDLVENRGKSFYSNLDLTPAAIDSVIELLPPAISEIANACFCLKKKQPVTLSSEACALLSGLKGRTLLLSELRLKLDAQFKLAIEADVRRVLKESTESAPAVLAIQAAIRHGMRAEIEAALTHKFAHVVALALSEAGGALPAPLPGRFLDLCDARGSPIRIALVALLNAKPHPDHLPALLKLVSDEWTPRDLSGDDPDYPIATAAIEAIAKMGALDADVQEGLYELALETRDSNLRLNILSYLAKTYGAPLQGRLFDVARGREANKIRRAAAQALLQCGDDAESAVVSKVTSDLLLELVEPVAVRLCLLLAWQGNVERVVTTAKALATNRKRRVLLILMIWFLAERDENAAREIAALLPADHPAVGWAFGEPLVDPADEFLDDLGDVPSVREVMAYVRKSLGSPRGKS